jgi:hypothetical protein
VLEVFCYNRESSLAQFNHLHEVQELPEHLVQVGHFPEAQLEQPAQLNFNVTVALSFIIYLFIAV